MIKTLPITEVRANLTTIVARVNKKLDEYIVTVNGRPAAVIMSAAEYESWKETNEILSDKKLMKAVREGERDSKKGRVYDWEDVKKELGINV